MTEECPANYVASAGEIASAAVPVISRSTVFRELKDWPDMAQQAGLSRSAKVERLYAIDSLPPKIAIALKEAVVIHGRLSIVSLFKNPPKLWQPPIPFEHVSPFFQRRAYRLQAALERVLEMYDSAVMSKEELIRVGLEKWASAFECPPDGAVSERQFWALLQRTLKRDGGRKDWANPALFLDDGAFRSLSGQRTSGPLQQACGDPDTALGDNIRAAVVDPLRLTGKEKDRVWGLAVSCLDSRLARCASAKEEGAVSSYVVDELRAVCPTLSQNSKAMRRNLQRKWRAYIDAGRDPDALASKKKGKVGRKPRFRLSDEQKRLLQADTIKSDSKQLAVRLYSERPECDPEIRERIDAGRFPRALIRAAHVSDDLKRLHRDPKKARQLNHTVLRDMTEVLEDGSRVEIRPGDWWEFDDMSLNQPFWFHDNTGAGKSSHRQGASIGRQGLYAMDVASGRWLGFDLIGRDRDAYRAEDIMRFFRFLFDQYGLPRRGVRLERGIWKSKVVEGRRIEDTADAQFGEERVQGGLQALGLRVVWTWAAKSKGLIESGFNTLQREMARFDVPNIGRNRGEFHKATRLMMRASAGQNHPTELGFPHIGDMALMVEEAMRRLNGREKGGRLQKGIPDDAWSEEVGSRPLEMGDRDDLWVFYPNECVVRLRAGHACPSVKGVGRLVFSNPELFARLGPGYRVHLRFDAGEPLLGAAVFNGEDSGSVRNFDGFPKGVYIGHAEFCQPAPQIAARGQADDNVSRSKAYNNVVTHAYKALGLGGGNSVSRNEHRDGLGNVARLDKGPVRDPFRQVCDQEKDYRDEKKRQNTQRLHLRSLQIRAANLGILDEDDSCGVGSGDRERIEELRRKIEAKERSYP